MDFARLGRQISQGNQQRAADTARVLDAQGSIYCVQGQFLTQGAGESIQTVNFPIMFVEKPLLYFGFEMQGAAMAQGSFPQASAIVVQYFTTKLDDQREYFTSANIATVTKGPAGLEMWVSWLAMGQALGAPLFGDDTAESGI